MYVVWESHTIKHSEQLCFLFFYFYYYYFLAIDFCRFCVVIRFFIPATTANDLRLRRIFYPRFYPLHLFSVLNSWERASIFPLECLVLNKGTTGTIFITFLVWLGPWLGIEPGTSRTRSQHSTTRLSRRRFVFSQWLLSRVCTLNVGIFIHNLVCKLRKSWDQSTERVYRFFR